MKRFLTLLAFVALTITANAVIQSGSCGDNVTFVLNDDGTLVISGSGNMKNYSSDTSAPWYYNRDKIIKVQIKNGITSIGDEAFDYCSGLTSVTIPNSVTSIGDHAFRGCSKLTSITIPNSVTSIGEQAFGYCSRLTSVTIPNSVTSIACAAFFACSDLTSVTIPNSVTSIGNLAFSGCSGLTSITIPNSVTSIEDAAFVNCSGLTSITIPNSVTSIGDYEFSGCSGLTSITIPNSVTSIGDYAFDSCSKLKEIHSQAVTPPTAYNETFKGVSTNYCKLYVPKGTKEDYAFAEGWKEFMNIIEEGNQDDEDVDALKAQIESLKAQNSALQSENSTLKTENESLTKENSALESKNNDLAAEVSDLKDDVKTLESENSSLKETIKKYAEGDLNLDGRTNIDDVVYLLKIDSYSSDTDALALLLDGSTAITLSEITDKYGDVEFYTLNGVKVNIPNQTGIYIVKKNGETMMVVVKK